MTIDNETITLLKHLEARVNIAIDILITKRDSVTNKQHYRYIIRKLEQALGAIHKAQDKVENNC
jgi:hypothetical protein